MEYTYYQGSTWRRNDYFLLPARKKKSPIMLDYQGFA